MNDNTEKARPDPKPAQSDEMGIVWPDPPNPKDYAGYDPAAMDYLKDALKARYQTQLDEMKGRLTDARANDNTRDQALYNAYLDVAKGQIERSQTRATFIQVAAAAIGTIYTGLLALAYSATASTTSSSTSATPMPTASTVITPTPSPSIVTPSTAIGPTILTAKGVIPGFFLGLAIVLAAVYISFLTKGSSSKPTKPSGLVSLRLEEELSDFIKWISNAVRARISFLHGAVISLGCGVLFLPVVFLPISNTIFWYFVVAAFIIVILSIIWPILEKVRWWKSRY